MLFPRSENPWMITTAVLWALDFLYLVLALRKSGSHLSLRILRGLAEYLAIRAVAMVEAIFYVRVKDWAAAAHQEDRWSKPS